MYDLQREIITFGPRMGHDDAIDALAYACKYAHPPKHFGQDDKGNYYKTTSSPSNIVFSVKNNNSV